MNNFHALVYDIKIEKAIQGHNDLTPMQPGIAYCEGWEDHANMGISVVCVYDWYTDSYRVFDKHTLSSFFTLVHNRSVLIGFNNVKFGNKVLAHFGKMPDDEQHAYYDILREVWIALQLDPDVFKYQTHGGTGLDALCMLNNLGAKTGDGGSAPILWQQGKFASVIDYCLNDIKLTKELFNLTQRGPIKTNRGELELRRLVEYPHD